MPFRPFVPNKATASSIARSSLIVLLAAEWLGCPGRAATSQPGAPILDAGPNACSAIDAPGVPEGRFGPYFPVDKGGVVWVLEGDANKVQQAMVPLGLSETRVVSCPSRRVVVFAPAVDERGADGIEKRLGADGAFARAIERRVFPPRPQPN